MQSIPLSACTGLPIIHRHRDPTWASTAHRVWPSRHISHASPGCRPAEDHLWGQGLASPVLPHEAGDSGTPSPPHLLPQSQNAADPRHSESGSPTTWRRGDNREGLTCFLGGGVRLPLPPGWHLDFLLPFKLIPASLVVKPQLRPCLLPCWLTWLLPDGFFSHQGHFVISAPSLAGVRLFSLSFQSVLV